ncbi:hypothetical protein DPEC_G00159430 [Dallia pectoralis]|uniref:Uncharacterized protein n=1 Tax=Dallia pectoralis TaxID=75939 RepID=A0ACC2GFG5_DALPE|nr:hypothetical protein DPEC_G00159430 [Dallia pectoralis]
MESHDVCLELDWLCGIREGGICKLCEETEDIRCEETEMVSELTLGLGTLDRTGFLQEHVFQSDRDICWSARPECEELGGRGRRGASHSSHWGVERRNGDSEISQPALSGETCFSNVFRSLSFLRLTGVSVGLWNYRGTGEAPSLPSLSPLSGEI